jgi:phosphoribosylanthranilate isomerase
LINKPFLKICGITRKEDLQKVVDVGTDAVGFIAFPKSPRYISPEALRNLLKQVDTGKILKVGVFVNASLEEIDQYLDAGIDIIQLHGSESVDFSKQLKAPVWRALRLQNETQISEFQNYPCEKFLIDSFVKGAVVPGGTGHVADWKLAKAFIESVTKDVLLAGGLSALNLKEAFEEVRPFGFDLSSGVEVNPGIKCPSKITELAEALSSL